MVPHRRRRARDGRTHVSRSPATRCRSGLRLQHDLRARGIAIEPVAVVDADGRVLAATRDVLATIARHGLVLATGHLSRDEIVRRGRRGARGGRHRDRDHPSGVPLQSLSVEDQAALAGKGALLERTFTTPHTGKVSWEHGVDGHARRRPRALGASPAICGQLDNPPVEDGLALLGRPAARGGLLRGGGARRWRSTTRDGSPACRR